MGNSQSVFSDEELEWYEENTFFTRKDILRLHRDFDRLTQGTHQITAEAFATSFALLNVCPFRDRIAYVFSNDDGLLIFDDFLDCLSVLSDNATRDVKSFYAFQVYDYDNDDYIGEDDIARVLKEIAGTELSETEMAIVIEKVFSSSIAH